MADVVVTDDGEAKTNKPIIIFGRDIREIKCFRSSFLFGICGGLAGGLICFMSTSKALFSTHIGFASLWLCVFGYWFPCRYKYESMALKVNYWKEEVKRNRKNATESEETE